ncbi:TetR/AcrR family transcriptional regulator [Streptomyces alfalfae]|uniref:TetR family transcriptional regulator n=1 Tax=Streptomyces alfalfae TaxID=1642299 RepID=A0A1P8TAP4_9ACTN|nr:TetR-like C-terminal domain-containing protein [Streptomyces alfalfae]AYA14997.1 TetR/AcrR family transcriptional regulator [Streptomyces fradiae]APY84689.1 TetR family transcriptional regulator [Streptomyces alfalfae]QQC93196.1 WHG domain-containing protein [Streptomyces alfalfae]QUI35506.1 WHG domain-containing protein [Streptomyces alfalfae]RXX47118.1 TetR/AcrR family transcriptional regulator [Streptomyces alfalfae]
MVRAGLTAERVTLAAAELADEAGLDQVTMARVASRLGVKDASLYSHVRGLEDLRGRVALLAADEKTLRIAEATVGRAGKDALVAFADAWRDYAHRHPGRYAATQIRITIDPELAARAPGPRRAVELTYGVLRGYGLAEPDLTDAVRLLRSTFHGFVALESAGGFGHERAPQRSWERALDALHATLTHWPSARDGDPS